MLDNFKTNVGKHPHLLQGLFARGSTSASPSDEVKIHPAIEYFQALQRAPSSIQLQKILSRFADPKSINNETFSEGVKLFIQLANTNPFDNQSRHSREEVYGDSYLGLHYKNELTRMWNSTHVDYIKKTDLETFAPPTWDARLKDGLFSLIYKGSQPAEALDELAKGPTIIDCGMFSQLGIWFGIRYMLGNEQFNQCFGRAPFFITQLVYDSIIDKHKPFRGNPLYPFLASKEAAIIPSVVIRHIANTPLYPLKHPGGSSSGQNCLIINERYNIFEPLLGVNEGITEEEVSGLLLQAFNKDRTPYEDNRLALYAANPKEAHPWFRQSYSQLIQQAEDLHDITLTPEEFRQVKQNPALELTFDFHKFATWLQCMESSMQSQESDYSFQAIDDALMPIELLNAIPFENKTAMDFSKFKQDTPEQKELIVISTQFCQKVLANEPILVILTGKAGVGKTASAICAAKELTARGKKVAWISEVMVRSWADQAACFSDLDDCGLQIDRLLADDPEAIFLDDNNLAGFSGNLLLEKIYSWYVHGASKGLFITSNVPINFQKCFGYKPEGYHFPPFNPYDSLHYQNWLHKKDLSGESLRLWREGQSIGAIVSESAWQNRENTLGPIELIPAFNDYEELVPIRVALKKSGGLDCEAYRKLRPIQQQWVRVFEIGSYVARVNGKSVNTESYFTANSASFENTSYKTIALEIMESKTFFSETIIDSTIMHQLIRVLNYAHDKGGRRVILINKTSHTAENLLCQIKQQLPDSEAERTWSRLMLLLCETEDSIFNHEEFNGVIEAAIPESSSLNMRHHKSPYLFTTHPPEKLLRKRPRGSESLSHIPEYKREKDIILSSNPF